METEVTKDEDLLWYCNLGTFFEGVWRMYKASPSEDIGRGGKDAVTEVAMEFGIRVDEKTRGQALLPDYGGAFISGERLKAVLKDHRERYEKEMKVAKADHLDEKTVRVLLSKHGALLDMEKKIAQLWIIKRP